MIPATPDVWNIRPDVKLKYDEKFYQLKPVNGYITGEQAKNLFLMSGLPPQILAHIWAMADRDADGKMDCNEFTIAMHLIDLKRKGYDIPKSLPPSMMMPTAAIIPGMSGFRPPVAIAGAAMPIVPPAPMANMAAGFGRPASPVDKPQRTCSVSSQDSPTGVPPPLIEWAVSQSTKLKFTQLFNSYDRTRTGFLTGAQAKNILVSTGLSQPVLAQIWSLSDTDGDGRLSCEEFVLAMHLAESVKAGDALPGVLPPDLIPPSHRRKRSTSIQSAGSGSSHAHGDINLLGDFKDDKLLQQTTFEDKRRENFEKGQAELEKRRLALLESQRKEQEERERKEREEQERRERIRQEQERRRQLELEKQLAKQRELELEKEEQRRKALEQREGSARKFPDSHDFGGPVKDRSCTDVIFLILLAIYLIFLLAAITIACIRGDPRRLVYGVDDYGNMCGLQNKNITGATGSGKDYRGFKYLKVGYTCPGGVCTKEKECVKDCPSGYEKTTLRRCMSSTLTQTTGSVIQSTLPYLQEVASDISLCWKEIILLSLISVGLSVLLLIIFRYAAAIIIWAILIIVTVAAIAVTIYVWVMWNRKKQELEGYEGPNRELREKQVKNWLIAAIVITILTVIYLLVVLFLRKKIKLVAALFEEAGKAIGFMPQLLLQPVLTFISLVAICCFLLVGFVCLQTSGTPLVDSSGKVTFPIDTFFQVMRWLSLFGFLWLTQFIFACQNLIVAGAISIWYFKRDKSKLSNIVCKSFRMLVLYHLGSAAFGSLIIAIMKAIRALFRMLQKYMDSQNQRCDMFWKIFQCCLGCFESYLKFLSKNAYIMIAIYGDSFCSSARRAFSTIASNAMKVAAVDGIGSFILFIGKVGVTVAVGFIALEVLKTVDGLHYIWIPVALVAIFAFLCSHCFLSIYEMTIETLLLCFCEDCQMNDGITRPYFMSKSLMSFVENSRRSARVKSVSQRKDMY